MPDITNALLAEKVNTLLTAWRDRELELQAWQSGTAVGGPYLDGRYPITNYLGTVGYYYSPAALQAGVTGPVASASGFATAASGSATAAAAAQAAAVAARDLALTYRTGAQAAQALAESAKVYAQAADANAQTAKTSATASATSAAADALTADADATAAAASAAAALASELAAAASAAAAATFDPSMYLPKTGGTMSAQITFDYGAASGGTGVLLKSSGTNKPAVWWNDGTNNIGGIRFNGTQMELGTGFFTARMKLLTTGAVQIPGYLEVNQGWIECTGPAYAGFALMDTTAPTDAKWWALEHKVGTLSVTYANEAWSADKHAMEFVRSGYTLTGINYGNSTDNPAHTFYGDVSVHDTLPVFTLKNTAYGSVNALQAYYSFRNNVNDEIGWLGYGSGTDSYLSLINFLGAVRIYGTGGTMVMAPGNGLPATGYHNDSAALSLRYIGDPTYGLVMGVLGSGTSYIQSMRADGVATVYDLELQPRGGGVNIQASYLYGSAISANWNEPADGSLYCGFKMGRASNSLTNSPANYDNANGYIMFNFHPGAGGGYGRQFGFVDVDDGLYTRMLQNGAWSAWRKMVTESSAGSVQATGEFRITGSATVLNAQGLFLNSSLGHLLSDTSGTYGTLSIAGAKAGYAGVRLNSALGAPTLMFNTGAYAGGIYAESAGAWWLLMDSTGRWYQTSYQYCIPMVTWATYGSGLSATMSRGTAAPSGGTNGDIYYQYT